MNTKTEQKNKRVQQDFHASAAFLTVPEDSSIDSQAKRTLWQGLHPIQRALLATDGSFTLLLAALHKEAIRTKLIAQKQVRPEQSDARLQLRKSDPLLKRAVLLTTAESNRPVTYAESSIIVSRLSLEMRRGLEEGSKPIGLLLRREALETHRILEDWGVRAVPHAAMGFFGDAPLLFRTYQIIARAMPIMTVSEYFPRIKNNEGEAS